MFRGMKVVVIMMRSELRALGVGTLMEEEDLVRAGETLERVGEGLGEMVRGMQVVVMMMNELRAQGMGAIMEEEDLVR